jgi:glutamine synthetase
MAKTVADVMNMVKDSEAKFVDFRFTDTRGKEQHVTVPISHFDEDKFTSGHAFDGSSIAGWKGIEASDMLLMPDPNTANIDPFYEEPTLILTCDVLEPGDGKPYERDPRSLAKRAEAYMKASGLGDAAYFGPEPEFFVFDSVRWNVDMSGSFCKIESEEAAWNTGKEYEHGNSGYRPTVKGGYFPTPPVDSFQDLRSEMCLVLESLGVPVEVHHHEVGNAGQMEIGTVTCCSLPRVSVKRKSTNFASLSFTMFITSATVLAINASPRRLAFECGGWRIGRAGGRSPKIAHGI